MSQDQLQTGTQPLPIAPERNIRADRQEFAAPRAIFVRPVPANAMGKRLYWSQDQFGSHG